MSMAKGSENEKELGRLEKTLARMGSEEWKPRKEAAHKKRWQGSRH